MIKEPPLKDCKLEIAKSNNARCFSCRRKIMIGTPILIFYDLRIINRNGNDSYKEIRSKICYRHIPGILEMKNKIIDSRIRFYPEFIKYLEKENIKNDAILRELSKLIIKNENLIDNDLLLDNFEEVSANKEEIEDDIFDRTEFLNFFKRLKKEKSNLSSVKQQN